MFIANDGTAALRLVAALVAELSVSDPQTAQGVEGRLNSMAKSAADADSVDLERATAALRAAILGTIATDEH